MERRRKRDRQKELEYDQVKHIERECELGWRERKREREGG